MRLTRVIARCMRRRYCSIALLTLLAVTRSPWIQVELAPAASPAESLDKCRSKQTPFFNSSMCDDDGAIILFYHIAKTGGTTIRRAFANASHVKFVLAKDVPNRQMEAFLKLQRSKKQSGSKRRMVLFIEFHGISPGLSELSKWIPSWRSQCKEQNIRFFAFTLLRDPVALHISAFTFFHREDAMTSTGSSPQQEQLMQTALPNRQCRVLHHGQGKRPPLPAVTSAQCDSVQHYLCRDWDWVGTTEKLNTSTLPALFSLVHGASTSSLGAESIALANVQNRTVTVSHEVRQRLQDLSTLDWELYKFFRKIA